MRQLRFVGPGEDRDHLVVQTADGADQFSLLVDEDLRTAVRADLPRLFEPETEPRPTISPREIQVRVRAGASPESLAAEVDVPLQRVLVFAGPVLAERVMITGEARRGRARRSTPDGQLVEFGTTVDMRFAAHGIEPPAVRWDARRREDGQWVVSASWRDHDMQRTAEWAFSLAARTVTPLDETAADLLSDRPIRPVAQAVPDLREPDPEPDVAPPPDPQAQTAPLPVAIDDDLFDQDAPPAPTPQPPPAVAPAPAPRPVPHSGYDELMPPLPLRLADPPDEPAPANGANGDHKSGKPRIPSWDDIMLGVRRKKD